MPFRLGFPSTWPPSDVCEQQQPVYLLAPYHAPSFGHVVRDSMTIIAANLAALALEQRAHRLVVTTPAVSHALAKYSAWIATDVKTWQRTVAGCGQRYLLFRNLVAGYGARRLMAGGACSPAPFLAQRRIASRLSGVPIMHVTALRGPTRVLILARSSADKRTILNVPTLVDALRARFAGRVDVRSSKLRYLSARAQLRHLASVSVLITTVGSASFRMLYLPAGAHVILVGVCSAAAAAW